MIVVFLIILVLTLFGYFVETGTIGDKRHQSSMVEAVDEDNPERVSVESRKKKWALFILSFSITRNFHEIFTRQYKTVRD